MAQDKQELLVWLNSNKLNFVKDALVEAEYTLEIVVNMTDDDMNGIFDDLKISNLKRPPFRTAVKKLKEKHKEEQAGGQKKCHLKKEKDELKESVIDNNASDSKVIQNGLVLNICISKYGSNNFEDLQGAKHDMTKLIDLWKNKFGYKMICNDYDKNTMPYVSQNDFLQKLDECRMELRSNKNNYDGLIFVFSGHGYKTSIVTSDSLYVPIDKIKKHFSAKEIEKLKDKPKIYIFDCCRSMSDHASLPLEDGSRLVSQKTEKRGIGKSGLNENSNLEFYHPFSNTIEIYGNTQGYAVNGTDEGGSLIELITKHLSNYAINDSKNKVLSNKTFQQLLYPVQRAIHNSQGGNQSMEIVNRSLGFDLYLSRNNNDERKEEEEVTTQKAEEAVATQKEEEAVATRNAEEAVPTQKQKSSQAETKGDEKINDIDWRFDFHYDRKNRGSRIHGIDKSGTSFKCYHRYTCCCFSTIVGNGMVCNSGIYKIKLKIDKISNAWRGNMMGLTSDNFIDGSIDLAKNGTYDWMGPNCYNWIGWAADDSKDNVKVPNGLYCGSYDSGRQNNIFRVNGFKYVSRSGKHSSRLPGYDSGDVVVMIYNSDLGQLSFKLFKENEQVSKVDSYIDNLPRGLTFYWFFGHIYGQMSITILN